MINHGLSGVILLSLLSFFLPYAVQAEPAGQPSDVRIVVDISGSMKESDPQNLRVPAVNLLVELLPDNARSGIWTFGHYVNMLVPLGLVDQAWREQAKSKSPTINSAGLYTNLTGALEKASWQMSPDSGFDQTVILLTDGRIDMPVDKGQDVNAAERKRLFNTVLPRYVAAGTRIHTLALSESADKGLLQQIALETGGMFLQANNADDLLKVFLKAFDRAVPVEQVPMDNNRFEIDPSVKEFTALIFRKAGGKETQLITPSGDVISASSAAANNDIHWHEDVNFDLITVSAPEAGSWQADADIDPDNRVQILSDLTLSVNGLPNSIFSGNPIELNIALKNAGEVVAEKAILGLTDVTLKVTAPDGRSGSKLLSDPEDLPTDGIFQETMSRLSQVGEYRFEITAVGRTFQRRQELTATLMEPLSIHIEDVFAEQRTTIRVVPEGADVDPGLSRVLAKVSSPDGSSLIQTLDFDAASNAWSMDLKADKGPGRYDVVLNIRGVSVGGATFKSKPDDIVRDFPLVDPDAVQLPAAELPAAEEESSVSDEPPSSVDASAVSTDAETAEPTPDITAEPVSALAADMTADAETSLPAAEAVTAEAVIPDLAQRFAEQEAETEELPVEEEGVAWWVWLITGLGGLLVITGAGLWWLIKHKTSAASAPVSAMAGPLESGGLTDDDFSGDFDSFADDEEEEIPLSDDESTADASPPASMSNNDGININLDDDFDIDPDENNTSDDEDWGEFDTDTDDPDKPA